MFVFYFHSTGQSQWNKKAEKIKFETMNRNTHFNQCDDSADVCNRTVFTKNKSNSFAIRSQFLHEGGDVQS